MVIFVAKYQFEEGGACIPVVDQETGRFRLYVEGRRGRYFDDIDMAAAMSAFKANLTRRKIPWCSVFLDPVAVDTSVNPPEKVDYRELDRMNEELASAAV